MVEDVAGGDEGAEAVAEDGVLAVGEHGGYLGVVVEVVAELFVDGLIHPVAGLLAATTVKVAVPHGKLKVAVNHVPHLGDAQLEVA